MSKNEIKKAEQKPSVKKNIAEAVLAKVNDLQATGGLTIPEDYSPENALNAAYLTLKNVKDKTGTPAEICCDLTSVTNSLLDMVVQGLSPAKNQCYFVVYGNQLTLMRSYMGSIAVARRFGNVKDVFAQVVYEGDKFEYSIDPATGIKSVTKHEQKLSDTDGNIVAAYATVILKDGRTYQEIMTIKEIHAAWGQGATKGNSPAHKNFAQEMSKKTVINRACKLFINTSSDAPILTSSYNRTTENEYIHDDEEYVDVDQSEIKDDMTAAIFGSDFSNAGQEIEEKDMPGSDESNVEHVSADELTDEEKAGIMAQEAAEADAAMTAEGGEL